MAEQKLVRIKQIAGGHAVRVNNDPNNRLYKHTVPGDVFLGPEELIRRDPARFVYADTGSPFTPPGQAAALTVPAPAKTAEAVTTPDPRKALDAMNEAELRAVAADEEVDVTKAKGRDAVLKALREAGLK